MSKSSRSRSRRNTIVFAALCAAGLAAILVVACGAVTPTHPAPAVAVAGATVASAGTDVSFAEGFAPIVGPALPKVVNVSSSKVLHVRPAGPVNPFLQDPFFRQFFGPGLGRQFQQPREEREKSLGSGVIVSTDGYILTNNHVVDGASDIRVSLSDHREFKARLVGTDKKTDVAVLKIDATGLPAMTLGDSSKLRIGEFVLAIGDPFGVGETTTVGIVSATGRGNLDIEDYEDFIQTDAAINPGNSGGALIDVHGDLVGINTAILASQDGGGNQGIGFAIPINMARHVMDQIVQHGKVVRGYLGVLIQPVTPALAKAFGMEKPEGALVADVTSGGPADKAGLKRGDVVVSLDGQEVGDANDLRLRVAQADPGTKVTLTVLRDGHRRDITTTLGELPETAQNQAGEGGTAGTLSGVQVQALSPAIAHQLGIAPNTPGVVVTSVDPGSAAADSGLRSGDVIQEVNRKPVNDPDDFQRAVRAAGQGTVLLLVNRNGATTFVAIEPH